VKFIFAFLAIFTSFTLSAALNSKKILESVAEAYSKELNDTFYYTLNEKPFKEEDLIEKDLSSPVYGPYCLVLKGIPPGTRFSLYKFNLVEMKKPAFRGAGYIDQDGEAWLTYKKTTLKLSSWKDCVQNVYPGEPIFSMVVLNDKKTYITTRVIPRPLEVYGKDGRYLTLEPLTYADPLYLAKGKNFKPQEKFTLSVHSKEEIRTKNLQATQEGTFVTILHSERFNPETYSIQITTDEQIEPMTISYDWKLWNSIR